MNQASPTDRCWRPLDGPDSRPCWHTATDGEEEEEEEEEVGEEEEEEEEEVVEEEKEEE